MRRQLNRMVREAGEERQRIDVEQRDLQTLDDDLYELVRALERALRDPDLQAGAEGSVQVDSTRLAERLTAVEVRLHTVELCVSYQLLALVRRRGARGGGRHPRNDDGSGAPGTGGN